MKLRSNMTIIRDDKELHVGISGTWEPHDECGPETVTNIEAWDYDGEVAITEKEWNEAVEILKLERNERP